MTTDINRDDPVECDICGKTFHRQGIGPHKASCGKPKTKPKTVGRIPKAQVATPEHNIEDACIGLLMYATGKTSIGLEHLGPIYAWVRSTEALVKEISS